MVTVATAAVEKKSSISASLIAEMKLAYHVIYLCHLCRRSSLGLTSMVWIGVTVAPMFAAIVTPMVASCKT